MLSVLNPGILALSHPERHTRESEVRSRDLYSGFGTREVLGIHESREPAADNAGFVSEKNLDLFHFLQIANLCQSMAISVASIGSCDIPGRWSKREHWSIIIVCCYVSCDSMVGIILKVSASDHLYDTVVQRMRLLRLTFVSAIQRVT